jgi:CRISPR-associated protein Csm1
MTKEQRSLFVKGDVSGIQEFIFNVKSDGAAKELKGRSFFIKLLNEVAIQYILDHFNVTDPEAVKKSKISTSGGNFILDVPTVPNHADIITKAQRDFTKALEYTGLNISIASIENTTDYEKDIHKLNSRCREAKFRFYNDDIQYYTCFNKAKVSELSEKWTNFTTLIHSKKHYNITKSSSQTINLNIHQSHVEFCGYMVDFEDTTGFPVEAHLESLFPENSHHKTKEFKDLCKNDIIDFRQWVIKEINGGEKGLEKLGILAMDVDGLGEKMELVKSETDNVNLDKSLRTFFNDRLRQLINDTNIIYKCTFRDNKPINIPKFKDKIYSVTAGGDDSFFVGKWNTILDFAIIVKSEFTHEFPELTISAGIIIVDAKFPVVRFADLVDSALKKAKYDFSTKGNLCLFDEVIKWDMLPSILEMRKLLSKKEITGGMLAKARLSANKLSDNNILRLDDFWKMGYYLRDLDANTKKDILKKTKQYISQSIQEKDNLKKRTYRKILPIAARLAELDKRHS